MITKNHQVYGEACKITFFEFLLIIMHFNICRKHCKCFKQNSNTLFVKLKQKALIIFEIFFKNKFCSDLWNRYLTSNNSYFKSKLMIWHG